MKFLGSYLHQLDDKGRVSLPASFRREAADQRFVLIQAHPPALSLYPETSWLEVEDRMRDLLQHNPDARMWVADMLSTAVEVSHYLDQTGATIALTLDAFHATLAKATPAKPLERIILARIPDFLPPLKRIAFALAPTALELMAIAPPPEMTARSLLVAP